MIEYVKVSNPTGEDLVMTLRSPEKSGFFIRNITGLGPPKATLNFSEAPGTDGAFYNSGRLPQRNIVLDIGFVEANGLSIEEIRQQTYRFFPIKRRVRLEIKAENRTGIIGGYVESNEPDIFSNDEGTQISIVCENAYFYGSDPITTIFSGSSSAFEFPFENTSTTVKTLVFGNVYINQYASVFYEGDLATGITMRIDVTGSVGTLNIYNTTLSQVMIINNAKLVALTGSGLVAGDIVFIETRTGMKSIYLYRNGVWYNILNALDMSSTWFTLDRGDNLFTYVVGSGALTSLQFLIEHRILYEGI